MSSWRKLLAQMAADPKPTSYTYDDLARVLGHLGFSLASRSGTSHRKWRRADPGMGAVTIGLVESGSGPIKKVYVIEMLRVLRENKWMPEGVE